VIGLISKLFIHFSFSCILEDQIDLFLIPKEPIESADIFVSEMALNFDFSPELMLDLGSDQLFLVKDL